MFGGKKGPVSFVGEQIETIIGKDTQIKGSINATGTIRIDGQFEGEISTASDAVIGETGNLKAQVRARNATVAGIVNGNMDIRFSGSTCVSMITLGQKLFCANVGDSRGIVVKRTVDGKSIAQAISRD